jgi:Uma2 family endonuclease
LDEEPKLPRAGRFFCQPRTVAGAGIPAVNAAFFPGAPDLALEILSLNNTRRELDERLRDFFESGTRLAWIIDLEAQSAEVCRSMTARKLVGSGGFLEGEDLLPGFTYPLADLYKKWDWE